MVGVKSFNCDLLTLQNPEKQETRFTSTRPAKEIISTIEEAAKAFGFQRTKAGLQNEIARG